MRQFSGGASNLTYLLRYPTRDLILRRAPAGTKARGAHDMRREYRIQSALAPGLPVRRADGRASATTRTVIGADFYVMERIDGIIPRSDVARRRAALAPSRRAQLCLSAIDVLVELHVVDAAAAGLADLGKGARLRAPPGRGLVGALPQRAHRRRPRLRAT